MKNWTNHWILPLAFGFTALAPAAALAAGGTITGKVEAEPKKYLEDTVVFVKEVKGSYTPQKLTVDQKGMKFIPRVSVTTAGDTVEFLNHDNVDHNVFSPDGEGYNLGVFKANESRTYTFKKEGVTYAQLCSIHPEMIAYIFVGQNPYSAPVEKDGKFTIKNVPPGTYDLMVWNVKLKAPSQSVTVAAGKAVEANFSLKR